MPKKRKPTKATLRNFTDFIDLSQEQTERQKHMSEQEKNDNTIKMEDIYY